MFRFIFCATFAVFISSAGSAQSVDAPLAEVGLERRIAALVADGGEHGFEVGALSALRAVEKTLQTRYDYGLGDWMAALPILRLNIGPANRNAKRPQANTLTDLIETAMQDLDVARGHLTKASDTQAITPFELTMQDVWFDVNSNGQREKEESALTMLVPILLGQRAFRQISADATFDDPITVRFDAADHAWLTAYTHMLSGFGSLYMAFDPTPVINGLNAERADLAFAPEIPNTFDVDAMRAEIDALKVEQIRIKAAIEPLRKQIDQMRKKLRELNNVSKTDRDTAQIKDLNEKMRRLNAGDLRRLNQQQRFIRTEIRAAEAKVNGPQPGIAAQFSTEIDTIYILLAALRQQPDAAKITEAHDHWRAMIAHNLSFWAALDAETDNDKEWIPNPHQTSVLPVDVDENVAAAWQAILADADAVLEGRLLVPHPLLKQGYGINIASYVENPAPLNILDWIHGIGAYPYAAKGPMITRQRWLAFQRLTGGNAGGFAFFFN